MAGEVRVIARARNQKGFLSVSNSKAVVSQVQSLLSLLLIFL